MKIADILSKSDKPELYKKGTSFMWTDKYISKQLLNIHLNPDIDLASRKMSTIQTTANWILETQQSNRKLEILDLGCGPGLYAEIFAQQGHNVTGVDISKTSIDYAKQHAIENNLNISYINANYLDLESENDKYDLVTLIYTDLGVLSPIEREKLLNFIHQVLKKGGTFIFDVLKDNEIEKKVNPKSWEAENSGFWKNKPYVALSESILYNDEKVILYQNIIIDEQDNIETYRFWTHFFSQDDVKVMLTGHMFDEIQFREDVLHQVDIWNCGNVIFCLATK